MILKALLIGHVSYVKLKLFEIVKIENNNI